MALTLTAIRAEIDAKLNDDFAQPIYDTGVPTSANLVSVNGKLNPYIVRTYSDLGLSRTSSFAGARGDDYRQPVNIMFVAPTSAIAEALAVKAIDKFLGWSPQYAGEMTKRSGGGTFTVQSSEGATEAYVAMVSFNCTVQLLEV